MFFAKKLGEEYTAPCRRQIHLHGQYFFIKKIKSNVNDKKCHLFICLSFFPKN